MINDNEIGFGIYDETFIKFCRLPFRSITTLLSFASNDPRRLLFRFQAGQPTNESVGTQNRRDIDHSTSG